MSPSQVVSEASSKFTAGVERFQDSLKALRTGRASASILDGVTIEAYGQQMPLIQLAGVTAPEAQLLQITPFDINNIEAISKAIRDNQTLGLNPSDDGRIIRVPIPALTEERRRELAKQIGQKQEECLIGLRSIRHDALGTVNQAKKDKDIGEDEAKRLEKQIDEVMNKAKSQVEEISKAKEKELLTL